MCSDHVFVGEDLDLNVPKLVAEGDPLVLQLALFNLFAHPKGTQTAFILTSLIIPLRVLHGDDVVQGTFILDLSKEFG